MTAASPLSHVLVTDLEQMEALRPEWEALLLRSRNNEPTLSPTWMLSWWRTFGRVGDRSLKTLVFYEGKRLVGIAPLLSRTASYRPGIPFKRVELLASGEEESDETCSEYLGLLAAQDEERAVAEAFAEIVSSGEVGAWDELVLPSMNAERALPHYVAEALRSRGLEIELTPRPAAPFVRLPGTFDAYLANLPSRRRYLVRKSLRAFETWAGEAPKLTVATSPEELDRARETLVALHRERWAAEGRSGVFDSQLFRAFHDRVMPELLARGALCVGSLDVKGEPIAAFYNIVWNGTSYFYQSGRRVDVPKDVRAGIVMHAALIEHAIKNGLREYDFLSGASQYKMMLATDTRPLVTLRAARPSLVEVARRTVELAYGQARRLRESVLRLARPTPEVAA